MNWTPGEPLELTTENYYLRSLTEQDATERYLGWLRDPEVNKFLDVDSGPHSMDSIREYIRLHDNRTSFLLGIFTKSDVPHVGNYSARCSPDSGFASVGVMVGDQNHWGRRIVLETRAAVLDFLFEQPGVDRVLAGCYSINFAAIYNFKTQGFRHKAIQKEIAIIEGKNVDLLRFEIDKQGWLARRRLND